MGTPLPEGRLEVDVCFLDRRRALRLGLGLALTLVVVWGCDDGCCLWVRILPGVVEVDVLDVEVELEGGLEPPLVPVDEVEVELEEPEWLPFDVLLLVVELEVEVEVDAGAQDSLSCAATPGNGRF